MTDPNAQQSTAQTEEKYVKTSRCLSLIRQRRASGATLDPWLQFPQNACSFRFGDRRSPLPLGALFALWDAGMPFLQACPRCGDQGFMVSFGGLFNVGGGKLVCAGCAYTWFHHIGGMARVADYIGPYLKNTDFRITGGVFGGPVASAGLELCDLLGIDSPTSEQKAPSMHVVGHPDALIAMELPPPTGDCLNPVIRDADG